MKKLLTEKTKENIAQQIDFVKTKLWMFFAPNYFKLLKVRYDEMKEALDERDKEYEADLDAAAAEYAELEATYNDLLNHYDELRRRIDQAVNEL